MKRNYTNGENQSPDFFTGIEVEHTPAHGLQTLFVTGLQPVDVIEETRAKAAYETNHIFFGANHSYSPTTAEEYDNWDQMIIPFLEKGIWCSLDIPINHVEMFLEGSLNEYNSFIPQIRVPLPYVKLWNYNTTLKIDDKGFDVSNPGVWSHSLHTLMDRSKFTDWLKYKNDRILK